MKIKSAIASATLAMPLLGALLILLGAGTALAAEEIDPSDPTKIYSYAGAGIKYTDYTNGESMTELRATGNLGLSKSDMVMFELGYGSHSGDRVPGDNSGWTNARARWFHLFPMQDKPRGYRGMGTQVDLQLAGTLKGTDGQSVLAVGALGAFGVNESWNAYLAANLVNAWDKNFDTYNGAGISVAPLFVYSPGNWWKGAYLQIWPNWTRFFSGNLDGEGSFALDLTTGGPITKTVMWTLTYQSNHQLDLRTYRRGANTGLQNDWNAYFNVTTYF